MLGETGRIERRWFLFWHRRCDYSAVLDNLTSAKLGQNTHFARWCRWDGRCWCRKIRRNLAQRAEQRGEVVVVNGLDPRRVKRDLRQWWGVDVQDRGTAPAHEGLA